MEKHEGARDGACDVLLGGRVVTGVGRTPRGCPKNIGNWESLMGHTSESSINRIHKLSTYKNVIF